MHSGGRSVVTIGAYDGVHLGHRRVIDKVLSLAADLGLESVIVTFDRHPAALVRPDSAPKLLTDLALKLELLEATGVDHVVVLRFDEARASETAEDFVDSVLVSELFAAVVVVGRDFHFGKGRVGNVALLESMGASRDMQVVPFDLVSESAGGEVVSSTRIRALIAAGDLEGAAKLLDRPHEVRGVVAGFAQEGRVLVSVPEEILLPPAGEYSCLAGCIGAALSEGSVSEASVAEGSAVAEGSVSEAAVAEGSVLVPAGGGDLTVGLSGSVAVGASVRVLFVGAPAV